jgi:hypothetical protein
MFDRIKKLSLNCKNWLVKQYQIEDIDLFYDHLIGDKKEKPTTCNYKLNKALKEFQNNFNTSEIKEFHITFISMLKSKQLY